MFISDKKIQTFSFKTYKNLKAWYVNNKRLGCLTLGLKKKFGRNNKGRIVVYSKGSIKSRIVSNIMSQTFKGFLYLAYLAQIKFDIKKTGIVGLFSNAIGCWFHTLLPTGFFLFDYIKIYEKGLDKKTNLITNLWPRFLFDMPLHSKICSLEIVSSLKISKKIKFIKSAGSRGLLLDNKYRNNLSIIVLPSLKIKIVNSFSVAFINYIENELYKYLRSRKAGYYINKGKKPTVRGVAKNPCDHPNGGRAKSVLLSRTPWGKVAKKSRKQSVIVNLKTLTKRVTSKKKDVNNKKFVVNLFQDPSIIRYVSKTVTDYILNKK